MSSNYSLKKRLILYISFFSISLGCVLVFSAYRIALEEINEILDAQMQNLAERIATHGPEQIQSQFDEHQRYHEEDLFVDVWAYTDQNHQSQSKQLVAPVEKAGFIHTRLQVISGGLMCSHLSMTRYRLASSFLSAGIWH